MDTGLVGGESAASGAVAEDPVLSPPGSACDCEQQVDGVTYEAMYNVQSQAAPPAADSGPLGE